MGGADTYSLNLGGYFYQNKAYTFNPAILLTETGSSGFIHTDVIWEPVFFFLTHAKMHM